MGTAFYCDHCNQYVDGTPAVRTSSWSDVEAELCRDCANQFRTWLQNGGQNPNGYGNRKREKSSLWPF